MVWVLLLILCLADNLATLQVLQHPGFAELNPIYSALLAVPYGIFLGKTFVLLFVFGCRKHIPIRVIWWVNLGMFFVVLNNFVILFLMT